MSNPFGTNPYVRLKDLVGGTSEEPVSQAMAELHKRGVKHDSCPRCNHNAWNVDLLEVPADSALSPEGLSPFPRGSVNGRLSLLALVCSNCGNSIFHNLSILGI